MDSTANTTELPAPIVAPSINFPASMVTMPGGNVGADGSVVKPAFGPGTSNPYVVGSLPLNTYGNIKYQNQSANQQLVVLDDGYGGQVSVFLFAASGANVQGGSDNFNGFKGRIRVFSSGNLDQCALRAW